MALFGSLSERLNHIFSKLTKRGKLTELEIKTAMREVRVALLEADVNLKVAKDFINTVSEKAVGQEILQSLNPSQQVIKIVNEELIALMGSTNAKLDVSPKPPTVIMMCGLQGAGKTTLCGKLAVLLKKQGKRPLLVAGDIYRPAAIHQLQVVGGQAGAEVFEKGTQSPVKTAKEAIDYARKMGYDTVILDTAGRLQIDETLMQELEEIKKNVEVTETLLIVDAMTGQEAVNVAKTFNERLEITGVILTKLDGDTRGGACLSIKAVTGKPIKFIGVGEKLTDLEPFYPDRMASRILGMGDVLSLIEKAQQAITEEDAKKMEKKMRENAFTLSDYLDQFEMMKKMGGVGALVNMLPGAGGKIKEGDIDEKRIERIRAIILSMTPQERENPAIINSSRKRRIATGSGTQVQDVNQLLRQFDQAKTLMKRMKGMKGMKGGKGSGRMPF
jgi:signal recognition particle subunit SRP54